MSGGHTREGLGIRFRCFGAASDVLTRKRGNTDPTYFQAPSWKTVDAGLPENGFGVPDIYVVEADQDKDADRLFVDGDGDYGEETCED